MPLTKTALLQLGFKNHVVLIHLIYLSKIPPTLVEILKNPKYIKVCQSPGQDMDRLLKGYGLVVEGMIDLQYVSTVYGLKGSLKSIYNQVCGKDMVRPSCACSNWEIIPLIDSQISYAALDAIQTRESFFLIHKMNAKQEEDMVIDIYTIYLCFFFFHLISIIFLFFFSFFRSNGLRTTNFGFQSLFLKNLKIINRFFCKKSLDH